MDYTWCALPHKDPRMLIWLTWSDLSLDARLFHGQLLTKKNQWCLQDALANLRKQLKLVHFPSMSHLKPGFKPSSSGMEPENSLNPSTCSTWRIYITPKKIQIALFLIIFRINIAVIEGYNSFSETPNLPRWNLSNPHLHCSFMGTPFLDFWSSSPDGRTN